jgi:hypothetical protein
MGLKWQQVRKRTGEPTGRKSSSRRTCSDSSSGLGAGVNRVAFRGFIRIPPTAHSEFVRTRLNVQRGQLGGGESV